MATQTSMSIDDIIEAIGSLSVVELAELIEKFKGKFGVTIAAPVAAAPAAGGAGGGAAVELKETRGGADAAGHTGPSARLSGLLWSTTCADLPHSCSLARAPRSLPGRRSGRGRWGLLRLPEVAT